TAFLSDPATVAAANDLATTLIEGLGLAARAAIALGEAIQGLKRDISSVAEDSTDIRQIEHELGEVIKALNSGPLSRIRFFGPGGIVEYFNEDELNREVKRLLGALERARLGGEGGQRLAVLDAAIAEKEEEIARLAAS